MVGVHVKGCECLRCEKERNALRIQKAKAELAEWLRMQADVKVDMAFLMARFVDKFNAIK